MKTEEQKLITQRDKILFKHYQYRGGADYIDIISAMDEYADYMLCKKAILLNAIITGSFCSKLLKIPSSILVEYNVDADELMSNI